MNQAVEEMFSAVHMQLLANCCRLEKMLLACLLLELRARGQLPETQITSTLAVCSRQAGSFIQAESVTYAETLCACDLIDLLGKFLTGVHLQSSSADHPQA